MVTQPAVTKLARLLALRDVMLTGIVLITRNFSENNYKNNVLKEEYQQQCCKLLIFSQGES